MNYQNIEFLVAMLIVGLSEEFFYRKIILGRLLENFNVSTSLIISSLLFAVILHNSESFIINITLRMFLGLILGAIAYKTKDIKDTVFIHTIYNLLV
ncbi:CPBP family intramembrane metalloprotease, partial [Staphylococcus coagulans]